MQSVNNGIEAMMLTSKALDVVLFILLTLDIVTKVSPKQ